MGLFDIFKKNGAPRISSLAKRIITNDLARLNSVQRGVGTKAAAYVLSGAHETVLSTLNNFKGGSKALEIGEQLYGQKKASRARYSLFASMMPYNIDVVVRYAQVMAAAMDVNPNNEAGSKHVPATVKAYFREVFIGVNKDPNSYGDSSKNLSTRVTPKIAITICEKLGGNTVDYFDVMYNSAAYWGGANSRNYRKIIDIKHSAAEHPKAFIEAGGRVHAEGREEVIRDIAQWKYVGTPPFFKFVLGKTGDGSKKVREAAESALKTAPAELIETAAIAELNGGTVNLRAAMVSILVAAGTPKAIAALKAHRKTEKTARINAAIDNALSMGTKTAASADDDSAAYTAIDDSKVDIPPMRIPEVGDVPKMTAADKKVLAAVIDAENVRIDQQIIEAKRNGYHWKPKRIMPWKKDQVVKCMEGRSATLLRAHEFMFLGKGAGEKLMHKLLGDMPLGNALDICLRQCGGAINIATHYYHDGFPFQNFIMQYLNSELGDFRYLESRDVLLGAEVELGPWDKRVKRKIRKGDFLRRLLVAQSYYMGASVVEIPRHAFWPYLAENLAVLDEAFGMTPEQEFRYSGKMGLLYLALFPKTPLRYFGPILEAATGTAKAGQATARALLTDVKDVDARLIALLDDNRQAVRAGTANWMAQRKSKMFIAPLEKRLKKEKSELARAAHLGALDTLGVDLAKYIGPKALITEAQTNIKKAKFEKLDWLGLDHLPAAHFKSGARVPGAVLKWWIYLAFKLKQPGGNKLFEIYLSQLKPESAQTFSTWIFDSWINYDTVRPSEEDGNKHAKQYAQGRYDSIKKWYKDYSLDQAFTDLKREFMGVYKNSGAASKGILALATHAPSATAAARVTSYLKVHGSRTSQASSLLSVLAAKGDAVSLQVVIASATRLKQKGVQKFAGTLLQKTAEERGWTMDELADRTIPTAGFDDADYGSESILELPCGPELKLYVGYLTDDLKIGLRNPDGKLVKGLSSLPDDNTKASKKQLSQSRKELKQVVALQTDRLYEALCAEREWNAEDWRRNFLDHPVMRKLIERIVWLGLDEDGKTMGAFRPTAEGDFTDADDEAVKIANVKNFRIAHSALLNKDEAAQWAEHLDDYEIKQLFTQFGRAAFSLTKEQETDTKITDREGWVTDAFTIRGGANKIKYERGGSMDGGYFNEYSKRFQSAGLRAVIEFSGNCLPEENVAAALVSLSFQTIGKRGDAAVNLKDVPPVLLSECWNDYHALAAKAAYDPNWKQNMPWY